MDLQRQNRLKFLGLALLFFAPLAAAFWMYYGGLWHPRSSANHGDLLDPVRALPAVALPQLDGSTLSPNWLQGRWTFLYYGAGDCDAACRSALYYMRQVRLALDRDQVRVQRVLLATEPCCDQDFLRREHAGLIVLRATGAAAGIVAALPHQSGAAPEAAHRIYLIDPLGNLVLSYTSVRFGKGMLEDMKRLLKWSSIG